jgi:hypothetical protein
VFEENTVRGITQEGAEGALRTTEQSLKGPTRQKHPIVEVVDLASSYVALAQR